MLYKPMKWNVDKDGCVDIPTGAIITRVVAEPTDIFDSPDDWPTIVYGLAPVSLTTIPTSPTSLKSKGKGLP